MEVESVVPVHAGASQLIAALCDELDVEKIVNQAVAWNRAYWKHSPGTHVKALIVNALCSRRPLYLIEEFFYDLDVELLFGVKTQARDFNDDALGRTLDRLHEAGSWKVYSTLALSALRKLELPLDALHNDTTSFSFYGEYANQEKLKVTYGHNKDGRPDLKQVVIGLGVTPQRIPIAAKVEDGNTDDKTWNHAFITRLRSLLSDEEWTRLTYVADSALATMDNVNLMMNEPRLSFITRLPDTFGLSAELKEEAVWRDEWESVGPFSEGEAKAKYRTQTFSRPLYGYHLRFVVVHSDQLEALQTQTLRRQMEKERLAMQKQLQQLQAERFACEHDAEQAIASFQKQYKWKWHECGFSAQSVVYTLPRAKRGRPKADEQLQQGTRWQVVVSDVQMNDKTLTDKSQKMGMFVLMTSHADSQEWTNAKVLHTYKGQAAAETRFRLLKDPAILDAVYLKHPHRIEALGIVMVMALLVYGVLEWRVREKLKQEKTPLTLPGKRKSYTPTGEMLLALLQTIQVMIYTAQGQSSRILSARVSENVKRVVELAGYAMTIYTTTNVEATSR
jgi:transposase